MAKDRTATPKGTLTLSNLGPGFSKDNVTAGLNTTFKISRDKVKASLQASDQTIRSGANLKSMKDIVATVDYMAPKNITINGKYELGTKKYTAGATWDGNVAKKATTLKLWYTNKDNLVAGEATVNVEKNQKANATFNQKGLLTAKYMYTHGDYTIEPSYNVAKKAPAIAVMRKMSAKDTLRLSYDIKDEKAGAEWNRKPYKVTLTTNISKSLAVGKPTLTAIYENVFEI